MKKYIEILNLFYLFSLVPATPIRSLMKTKQLVFSVVTVYVKYPPEYKWVFYIYVPRNVTRPPRFITPQGPFGNFSISVSTLLVGL